MSPSVEREIQGVVARAVDEKLRPLILETRKQLPPRVIPSSILDNTRGGEKIKGLFQQLYIGESFRTTNLSSGKGFGIQALGKKKEKKEKVIKVVKSSLAICRYSIIEYSGFKASAEEKKNEMSP
ncbi:hypothetical protein TWF594_003035 [Orbilia oligospora]|nr:hypothetical protein TWF706_007932 [Orbilia oligospora]KAF3113597.1 hypothetical protein TWF103_001955 [Orbilia oligospora]KAF3146983.1 hypothetical protein TWF594_003035 [Orbilia oligospora]